jgi:predicted ATPase/DNA-binding XRE family transcriptional regulator
METFGEWLRGQRNDRKLTREEFANRVGCSVAMLRKMEDGERRPSAQIAELIANCLGISLDGRAAFIKVARGEWSINRLISGSKQITHPNIFSARAAPPLRVNLPVLPVPLIGRQNEVTQLSEILNDRHCRMLTITGPGGIGKTRLAIEAAAQWESKFPDGIYFVPLASVNSSRFIIPIIADSLGFTFQGESSFDSKSQLFNYLNQKQLLLLVDNLEHLLGDSQTTNIFAELLQRAAQVKLLVTSREIVGLQNEWVYELHGLPLPQTSGVEGTAVELFLQRARRAYVGFDATTEDYPAIVRICQLVNGMPLGIELAAAWARTLSCAEIASEIEQGLDFLAVSAKDLPPRHRSMRAVFDHSWKLLSEEEQKALLQLSIFQGGFSRDAAQQVADVTLPALSDLVTKSLIHRSGKGRYNLHEMIRQYTVEQLVHQPQVKQAARVRHAHYFMMLLSQEDGRLRSAAQHASLVELTTDIDNIRSAQEWALTHKEFALIEKTLRAYSTFFDMLGWAQEGLDYLGRVLDVLESMSQLSRIEQVAQAHVLTARALFAFRTAQHNQACAMLHRSLEMLRPLNEPRVLVETLTYQGIVTIITGNPAGALELFKEGLQIARDIDDQWYAALCLTELVGVNMLLGETQLAHQQFQSALEAWRKTGDLRFTAFGLYFLGVGAAAVGNYTEAHAALEESIAINTSVGDRWGLGIAYRGLGLAEQGQGKHTPAIDSFQKSLQIFTELGACWDVARVLSEMGRSTFALGNDSEAENLWRESVRLALETHGILTALESVVGLTSVQAKHGNNKIAFQFLLTCIHHPAILPQTKIRAEKLAAELKEKLSPQEIQSAQILAEANKFEDLVKELIG